MTVINNNPAVVVSRGAQGGPPGPVGPSILGPRPVNNIVTVGYSASAADLGTILRFCGPAGVGQILFLPPQAPGRWCMVKSAPNTVGLLTTPPSRYRTERGKDRLRSGLRSDRWTLVDRQRRIAHEGGAGPDPDDPAVVRPVSGCRSD
jgi:hypothetical protein